VRAYRSAHPDGALLREADVIEIEAFARLGDRETLVTRARAFLERHPNDPGAPRVRTLSGAAPLAP
jgi:hypothetical protein